MTAVSAEFALEKAGQRRRLPPALIAGGSLLGVIVGLAIFAPLVTSYSPTTQDLTNILAGPSATHILGTDQLGRDVWSRLVYGARTDLFVAFIAVISPFVLGTIAGALAGYFGRALDSVVMRTADVVVAFPFYVLVMLLVFLMGPGTISIIIAITVVSWVSYARIVRGATLVAKNQEFVLAAKAEGFSTGRIIGRHVLPNVVTQAIVFATSDIVLDILAIVTLGYLGLGIPPPTPDWGEMMASGQQFLTTHWELSTIPGIAVVLTGLGLSLLGDGLAEVLSVER
ncbi:MAG TPA: ABC transporter permease [Acidimicrobiales bacterium]|nr:ABC transporter permease [Acidimicrobiales bacterium]